MPNLKTILKKMKIEIDSVDEIISTVLNSNSFIRLTPSEIKEHFDDLVIQLEGQCHERYKESEANYMASALKIVVDEIARSNGLSDSNLLKTSAGELNEFFLGLSQSRKARAGSTFEKLVTRLFEKLEYPNEKQKVINGKPDFILPSAEYFRNNPSDCIIFTLKRTLRERWRQIISEGSRGAHFFLGTIDEKITKAQLKEASQNRIILVVPQAIKARKYSNSANVLSFRQFFEGYLDPAVTRWKTAGIIK